MAVQQTWTANDETATALREARIDLSLSIGAKVTKCSTLSNRCELLSKLMCHINRKWHEFFCVIAGIAKHHTLVTSTLKIERIDR